MDITQDVRLVPTPLDIHSVVLVGSADVLVAWYRYSLGATGVEALSRLLAPLVASLRHARASGDLIALQQACRRVAALGLPAGRAGAAAALTRAVEQLREDLDTADLRQGPDQCPDALRPEMALADIVRTTGPTDVVLGPRCGGRN